MMKKIPYILPLFISFVFYTNSLANVDNNYVSVQKLYTVEDGLSQSRIQCLFQDFQGFLWIGTRDGLNRFDGYNFKVYRHQPGDTNSISDNNVHSICEDENGTLWIATDKGLNKFDKQKEKFYYFLPDQDDFNSADNVIFDVFLDKEQAIWIKTEESIARFNRKDKTFTHYKHYVDHFTYIHSNNSHIINEALGKLWVGTKDGLYHFDRKLDLFEQFVHDKKNEQSISNNVITAIYEDEHGELWIGTQNGLNKYNEHEKSFERYLYDSDKQHSRINTIFEDHKSQLWIGTKDGIIKYENEGEAYEHLKIFHCNNRLYQNLDISTIMEDNSRVIWLGTNQGLMKLDNKEQKFKLYRKSTHEIPNFSSNNISSILVDEKGLIWLGTWGYGLNVFNRNTHEVKRYSANSNLTNRRLSSNNISAILQDSKQRIWIGSQNGIDICVPKTKTIYSLKTFGSLSEGIFKNNKINSLMEDKYRNVWIASSRGLFKYNLDENELESIYKISGDDEMVDINKVLSLEREDDGSIWLGTENGLVKFNHLKGYCKQFNKKTRMYKGKGLSSNTINCLCNTQAYLWIGTKNGLNRMNKKSKQVKVFAEVDGLPNNMINAIEIDNNGNVWGSTNKGLFKLNTTTEDIETFDVIDGIQSYEYNIRCSYKNDSGELFFGGVAGFNSFYPDSVKINRYLPNIVITSFKLVNNKETKEINPKNVDQVIVKPYIDMFSIQFAALDYTFPSNNHFAYVMAKEGKKNLDWINIKNKNSVIFTNLAPGKYIFRVKGSNNDLVWNDEGTQIDIVIEPPFYKTQIAYYLYVLLVVFLVLMIIRVRTRTLRKANKKLKEKEQAIEKQKEELTIKNKDITDSLNYAEHIQKAMLPPNEFFNKFFTDSFILHKPKHIVSGDFYWINEAYGKINVAAVDCTGHGVPGAFMSLIGIELFRRICSIRGLQQPSQILNVLNDYFAKIFEGVTQKNFRDGMDVALISIDKIKSTMEFAGAFNPVYIVRNDNIIEYKGDRFSIGLQHEDDANHGGFHNNIITLEQGDVIYLFTDGYVDQFGGPYNKKYKKRRFRHLLLNIYKEPLSKQREIIEERIASWRGDQEQVDDILIIGIKPI
jgi:ligand-binding sensor domain-containing protein/serine phosphatase RsbU (regulator of sigma subunit)